MNYGVSKACAWIVAVGVGVSVMTDLKAQDILAPLFPFVISHEAPDNVTSMAHLLDAPAGKHGFVRVEDGRFVTDAGPIRFNATNLTGPANFPSHEEADRLAARLARFGINCVRLHYFDAPYGNFRNEYQAGIYGVGDAVPEAFSADPEAVIPFDQDAVDRLDYLIAALKKRGIYVNMNLHVARFPKGLSFFVPEVIASEKEYAKKLLSRVNPYTGLAYTDDPCMAMIEINNEDSFLKSYLTGRLDRLSENYATKLRRQWNDWLGTTYGSTSAMRETWEKDASLSIEEGTVPVIDVNAEVPPEARRDFYRFLVDTEEAYWMDMADYVKNGLKAKVPVSGTQLGFGASFIQAELDYVDSHAYWGHPAPVNKNWRIDNVSQVNTLSRIQQLATQRVLGRPYTVSEYNHPFPNQFGAEGQPMMHAYGALQGWDGVFEYTWHHRRDCEPGQVSYFFSTSERSDVLAHMQACAAMFLRGDVHEAEQTIVAATDRADCFERLASAKQMTVGIEDLGFLRPLTLIHKTGVDLSGQAGTDPSSVDQAVAAGRILLSDTGEICWNREERDAGYFTVNTAGTRLFSGFPQGRTVAIGNVTLKIGKTRLNWATISLVSRFAEGGFGEDGKSANILLAATGEAGNSGMKLENVGANKVRMVNSDWGAAPVVVEGIPAVIDLPSLASRTHCYALDPNGDRMNEVPVKSADGKSQITIGPEHKTIWYEIEVR